MPPTYKNYQKNGYVVQPFANTPTKSEFINTLRGIQQERFKSGYSFKLNQQLFRKDLIPNAHEYSDVFFNILKENNVHDLVTQTLGADSSLIHISIVDSIPPGYMTGWHSDGYDEPIHKVIVYPNFGQPAEKRLDVLEGHIKGTNRLFYNKFIQKWEPRLYKNKVRSIYSSDDSFLFVNTRMFHRAFEVTGSHGALRILYSFRKNFKNDEEKKRYIMYTPTTIQSINDVVEKYNSLIAAK